MAPGEPSVQAGSTSATSPLLIKLKEEEAVDLVTRAYAHPKHREASLDPMIFHAEEWFYKSYSQRQLALGEYRSKYREVDVFIKNESVEVVLVECDKKLWRAIKTPIGKLNAEMIRGLNGNDAVLSSL